MTKTNEAVRVSRIHIANILGVEDLEIIPGALTVLEGGNGVGKTSVLEAVRALVGGADATLIRNGTDTGEVVLELSDGTEFRRRVTATGTDLTGRHPITGKVRSPGTRLSALLDAMAFNPVTWLNSRPAEQVETLLDSLPMQVTADQVAEAVGPEAAALVAKIATEGHALRVLDAVHTAIYTERTGVNRDAKSARATARELHASLPPVAGDDVAARLAALREERNGLQQQLGADLGEVARERETDLAELRTTTRTQIDKIRADAEAKIREVTAESTASAERMKQEAESREAELRAAVGPRAEALAAEIATLEAQAEEAVRAKTTREMAERTAADADAAERRSEALTAALSRVDALKTAAVERLPIEGLEIRDGALFLDGHPFARVNQAERVKVALHLAQLRARRHGGLPLVCVDGLECLDDATFAAFREHAPKVGLQLVVARVGEGPLSVTEIPAAEVV